MGDELEERLKSHSRAFEGLMSLIPAKEYYGKDASITSEQWRKTKKQTTEERQNAKRAKLDPASHKTAKDVLDENARKRKRELEGDDSVSSSDIDLDIEKEKPLEGMKLPFVKPKKQKTENEPTAESTAKDTAEDRKASQNAAKADKRKQKREQKKEKMAVMKQKQEKKRAQKEEALAALGTDEQNDGEGDDTEMVDMEDDHQIDAVDVSGLVDETQSTATTTPADSGSSASVASAASSTSSIVPPTTTDETNSTKPAKRKYDLSPEKHEVFKERLAARLAQLRAARKADGPDGRPARNRAELIEARRKKEAERRVARKASRQMTKEEEARAKAEAELARLRGSGSPYSISGMFPPGRTSPELEQQLAFGRVAWSDGQQLDTKLSGFLQAGKKKGPSDPKTALEAAKKKQAHINSLDEEKRADIEEKELWLSAKKRAQGEKVHDDLSLLKKSVKRKEKLKAKSKKEWKERITNIEHAQHMKQKKREENLTKRREESKKGQKGKKGSKKPVKKVKRAGFEGTFKGRN